MWPVEHSICIALGSRRLECGIRRRGRWQEMSVASYPLAENDDWNSLKEALHHAADHLRQALAASAPGRFASRILRVRVLVAERWLSLAGVPWSPVLAQAAAVPSYVSAHLSATGITLQADDLLRLNDAPWRQPVLVAAYPAVLLELLQGFAKGLGGKLESVLPAGVAAVSGVCRRLTSPAVVAVLEGGEVSFWRRQGSQTLLVAPMAGRVSDLEDLIQAWQRAQLKDPRLAGITPLHLLDIDGHLHNAAARQTEIKVLELAASPATGKQPALRLFEMKRQVHPLDAAQKRPTTGPLRFALAIVLTAMTLTLVYQWLGLAATLQDERQRLSSRAPAAKQNSPALNKDELLRARAVNTAIRQLNLPVGPLMQAMQPPKDIRVALLGAVFTPAGDKGSNSVVKLTGETRSGIDMARYVAYLAERKPFVGAYLVNHEVVEADALKPYRFTVEARWRE